MKISRIKEYLPLIQALAEGKTIQHRKHDEWYDLNDEYEYEYIFFGYPENYRIKPTPTLRPWKPEEVPVGALIRRTNVDFGSAPKSIILSQRGAYTGFICPETFKLIESMAELLVNKKYEHSLDHGITWKPCGVME